MQSMRIIVFSVLAGMAMAACEGMPALMQPFDDKPAYAKGSGSAGKAESRPPLDVPPDLQSEVSVPIPEQVAVKAQEGTVVDKKVAGKAVSLDARIFDETAGTVFSSVVDAMTALNMPVESVDSPSGTITTAWIRQDANTQVNTLIGGFFGGGPEAVRHRFIVRVLRLKESGKTQLEIRTLGQAFINRHWVNRPIQRKASEELFSSVEEQLARRNPKKIEQGATIRP